ncbi:MAG: hypothetical protein R3E08_05190 [Thiotrichaceae bacterium]
MILQTLVGFTLVHQFCHLGIHSFTASRWFLKTFPFVTVWVIGLEPASLNKEGYAVVVSVPEQIRIPNKPIRLFTNRT